MLKAFPLIRNKASQHFSGHCTRGTSQCNKRKNINRRYTELKGRNKTVFISRDNCVPRKWKRIF